MRVRTPKVKKDVRFVVFSDLHGREFGKENKGLIDRVRKLRPDFVLMCGDIMTAKDIGNKIAGSVGVASHLIRELSAFCPVYFSLGNHESRVEWMPELFEFEYTQMLKEFREAGAVILDNESLLLEEYGIRIYGLSLPFAYYKCRECRHLSVKKLEEMLGKADPGAYNILLAHDPEYLPSYAAWGEDLSFSGHYHGGIMRLPFLGGVISPKPQLFPPYSGGMYRLRGKRQYVCCGLGCHTLPVRVFNPAELNLFDLQKGDE